MKERSVCFYSISTHLGGAERSLLELVSGLNLHPELGYRPWVLLPKTEGPLREALEEARVPFECVPMPPSLLELSRGTPLKTFLGIIWGLPSVCRYIQTVSSFLRNKNPALIHSNGIKCHLLSTMLGQKLKISIVWHIRDILSEGFIYFILKFLGRLSGIFIVANSQATADPFRYCKNKPTVIYNGFDTQVYQPKPNRFLHEKLGVPSQKILIGILGILARWKGQLLFLEMAKQLVREGVDAHFVIMGDEIYDTWSDRGYKEELHRKIVELNLHSSVSFTGFIKETVLALNSLDILVHASIRPEPFGRVVVESMACGVPVVCSGAGGVLEIVEHEVDGLLYSPGHVDEMATSVKRLVRDPELRNKLREAALIKVKRNFSLVEQVMKMANFYNTILATRGRQQQ